MLVRQAAANINEAIQPALWPAMGEKVSDSLGVASIAACDGFLPGLSRLRQVSNDHAPNRIWPVSSCALWRSRLFSTGL